MASSAVGPCVRKALFGAMGMLSKHPAGQEVEFEVTLPSRASGRVLLDISRVIKGFSVKNKEVYIEDLVKNNPLVRVNLLTIRTVDVGAPIQRCGVFHAIVEALLHTPQDKCWGGVLPTAVMVQAVINPELREALRRNPDYIDQSMFSPASGNPEQLNPSFVKFK